MGTATATQARLIVMKRLAAAFIIITGAIANKNAERRFYAN